MTEELNDDLHVQPPNQSPTPTSDATTSGLAVAGLVLGIVGIATSFIPIINNVSFLIAIVGLILAIVGFMGIRKGTKKGKGIAIAALVLNIVTFVVVLASQAFYGAVLDEASESLRAQPATSTEASSTQAADANVQNDAALVVSIDNAEVIQSKYADQCLVVTYTFTNNSTEDQAFSFAVSDKAFQNGVELENAYSIDEWDTGSATKEIKSGTTITVQQGFKLEDLSPVTVEVKEIFDLNGELLAERTFTLE